MGQFATAIAAMLLTASVSAADGVDMHQGLRNPDLSPPPYQPTPGSRLGAGEDIDFHHGLGNPDLSPPPREK